MNNVVPRWIVAGLVSEAIYLGLALGPLSLIAHATEDTDLSGLTGASVTAVVAVTVGLLTLFALYGLAVAAISGDGSASVGSAILLTAVFSCTMIFVFPATALDVYNYAVEGH